MRMYIYNMRACVSVCVQCVQYMCCNDEYQVENVGYCMKASKMKPQS